MVSMRITLTLTCIFFASFCWGQVSYEVFDKGFYQGVKDQYGEIIIEPIYDQIGWYDGDFQLIGELVGYLDNGKWGLLNLKTKKRTRAIYYALTPQSGTYILAAVKGNLTNQLFYGILDDQGNVKIICRYFSIEANEVGYEVASYDQKEIKIGFYNSSFQDIISPIYKDIELINEDLLFARDFSGKGSLFRVDGMETSSEKYDDFTLLKDGLRVESEGRYGLLSLDASKTLLKVNYKEIMSVSEYIEFPQWQVMDLNLNILSALFADSIDYSVSQTLSSYNGRQRLSTIDNVPQSVHPFVIRERIGSEFLITKEMYNGKWSVLSSIGAPLISNQDSIFFDDLFLFGSSKGKWDIYNKSARKLNSESYESVLPNIFSLVPVKSGGYWGFIDFKGLEVISLKYDALCSSYGQKLAVNYLTKWGVIDLFDNWILAPIYEHIQLGPYGIIAQRGERTFLISYNGEVLYETFGALIDSGAFLEIIGQNQRKGAISYQGKIIVDPIYEEVGMVGDYFWALQDQRAVLIDDDGKLRVQPSAGISRFIGYHDEKYMIQKDGRYGFVDLNGKLLIANRYDSLLHFSDERAGFKLGDRWGFIDFNEHLLVQPNYDQVFPFEHNLSIVRMSEDYGLIDPFGKLVLSLEYDHIDRIQDNYLLYQNQKVGIADLTGQLILRTDYDSIVPISQNLLIVEQDKRQGLLDFQGYLKLNFNYETIQLKGDHLILKLL